MLNKFMWNISKKYTDTDNKIKIWNWLRNHIIKKQTQMSLQIPVIPLITNDIGGKMMIRVTSPYNPQPSCPVGMHPERLGGLWLWYKKMYNKKL